MDLSSLLSRLRLSPSSACPSHLPDDSQPFPPITEVLRQLQDNLGRVAQSDDCDSKKATVIGQAEQLFKIADSHWLTSPDDSDRTNEVAACARRAALVEAYVGMVQALTRCAALPACEADSGLPGGLYRNVPAEAVAVCSALCGLLRCLGPDVREGAPDEAPPTSRGASPLLFAGVAPLCCVFAVSHMQVGRMLQDCAHSVYTVRVHCTCIVYSLYTLYTMCIQCVVSVCTHCIHTVCVCVDPGTAMDGRQVQRVCRAPAEQPGGGWGVQGRPSLPHGG